jgi:electron transfer flavoprotein beta subunit
VNIAVLLGMVPDLVEDLEIDASGTALDTQWLRYVLSESDDHALEQALLLKDAHGGKVVVLALDFGEADEALFSALAKGADEAVKITGVPETSPGKRVVAALFRDALTDVAADLVLTGVQAIDDADGHLPGLLAGSLGLPYVGVTRSVEPAGDGSILVQKEYPGGLLAEMEVQLPAIIGVLSAPQPPRYVPVARIRDARKTRSIGLREAGAVAPPAGLQVRQLLKPEPAERAQMLEGDPADVARQVVAILVERGIVR